MHFVIGYVYSNNKALRSQSLCSVIDSDTFKQKALAINKFIFSNLKVIHYIIEKFNSFSKLH